MIKEELLSELSNKIRTGEISREELFRTLGVVPTEQGVPIEQSGQTSSFSVMKMLYILGASIVVIGIFIFFSQIWDDIGGFVRILVTLGLGLIITASGSTLLKSKPEDTIGLVFHFIGGMLIPGGAIVTLSELEIDLDTLWPATITFAILFAFYLLLNSVHKNAVLTFFAIANGTTFVYLLVGALIDGPFYLHEDVYEYLTMAIGLSYLSLAHAFRVGWNEKLIGVLYFFGTTGFLGAAFLQVFDSGLWELLYFVLVIGGLYLSVYEKSRAVLIMSTIFLIAHVSYITGEYFADSLGWPIALILLGFVFIGLGYVSININKKYIRS